MPSGGLNGDQSLISDSLFFYQMNALSLRGFAHSGIRMPKLFAFFRRAEQQSSVQGATGDSVRRRRFTWTEIVVILLLLMVYLLVCVLMAGVDTRFACLGINAVAFWLFAYAGSARHCVALQTNWNQSISLLLAFFILDVCYVFGVSQEPVGWMIAVLALAFVFSSTLAGFNMYVKIKPHYRLEEVVVSLVVMLILSLLLAIVLEPFMVSGLTGTPSSIEVLGSLTYFLVLIMVACLYLAWAVYSHTAAERVAILENGADERLLGEDLEKALSEYIELRSILMLSVILFAEAFLMGSVYLTL